jgi:hypothetical protein
LALAVQPVALRIFSRRNLPGSGTDRTLRATRAMATVAAPLDMRHLRFAGFLLFHPWFFLSLHVKITT